MNESGEGLRVSEEALLRPSEVARLLAVSRSWVYAAAHDGRLPAIRLGGADGPLRFERAEIADWLTRARDEWRPAEPARRHLRRVQHVNSVEGSGRI